MSDPKETTREQRLEAALRDVRNKGIVAGAAVMARAPDWRERVTEVLDIIDAALEPDPAPPAFVERVNEGFRNLVERDNAE